MMLRAGRGRGEGAALLGRSSSLHALCRRAGARWCELSASYGHAPRIGSMVARPAQKNLIHACFRINGEGVHCVNVCVAMAQLILACWPCTATLRIAAG